MLKLWRALPYSPKRQETTVITPKMKQRIKRALRTESPTLHIGKEGATAQIVNEAVKQLDSREMIKAKILKTALHDDETKNIAAKIAEETDSELVEVRGHTFLLYKQKPRNR